MRHRKTFNAKQVVGAGCMAAAVLLAACGTSSTPDDGIASAKSGWTTLGTRAAPAHDGKTITKNADAVWSDYDPAPLYPGSKSLPLQYITMRDGVQLAAHVTVPADDDGTAREPPMPVVLVPTSSNGVAGNVVRARGGSTPSITPQRPVTLPADWPR